MRLFCFENDQKNQKWKISLTMRWSEAGYLSQFVLTHALRQVSVSLILGVRLIRTNQRISNPRWRGGGGDALKRDSSRSGMRKNEARRTTKHRDGSGARRRPHR